MPSTGSIIQHYEIGDRLGSGGMGEVYRGRDTRLGRPVALKFIDPAHDRDPDRRARFLKEAQAAAMLRLPAVATTYDIGEDDGTLFIVMELVEGETLVERLRRGLTDELDFKARPRWPLDQRRAYADDAARPT